MKKNQIGMLIISSAVIWAALIIGCAFILRGTEFKEPVVLLILGAMLLNFIAVFLPLSKRLNNIK